MSSSQFKLEIIPSLKPFCYSQAIQVDKTLYVSGQLGLNKEGVLASGIKAQTRQTLENIGHILDAAGTPFKNGTTHSFH